MLRPRLRYPAQRKPDTPDLATVGFSPRKHVRAAPLAGKNRRSFYPLLLVCVLLGLLALYELHTYLYAQTETKTLNFPIPEADRKPSAFERAHRLSYELASKPPSAPRIANPFNISTWAQAGTGGLSDWDRTKLAEIYSDAGSLFEYGLGESTKLAALLGVPRYSGIDSDANWVAAARDGAPDHFRFYFADVGDTPSWGQPDKPNMPKNVLNYQVAPLVVERKAFDVYMVDGRWRAPCALLCMLHASARGGGGEPLILIHDFVDRQRSIHCEEPANCNVQRNRIPYHRVKEVADMVDHSGNKLAVFRRRANVTDDEIFALWEEMMSASG